MSSIGPSARSDEEHIDQKSINLYEEKRIGILICGVTGCGKTSLIRMLNGDEPTPCSLTSDTNQTKLIRIKNTDYYACDTPGFLDNRDENDRSTLFNSMLQTIHQQQIKVKKIMILMSGAERLNDALVPWLADLMVATRARVDMNQVYLILTKLDTSFAIKNAQTVIQKAEQIFKPTNIITCGYNGQGINNSQVQGQFTTLESFPDINVEPNFETTHHPMLSSLAHDIHTTEMNHKIDVAKEILSKERQIKDAQEQLRQWKRRSILYYLYPGFSFENMFSLTPCFGTLLEHSIQALRNDQTRISQSLADVTHFHESMRVIGEKLESRSDFMKLFQSLITS